MDQAESLRRLMNQSSEARVIAVASGKGGVGKSNLCVNIAISLQSTGERTVILDMDSGMGNVDVIMGVQQAHHLLDMIKLRLPVWDVIETTSYGISYIAGGTGLSEMTSFSQEDLSYFQQQLQTLAGHFDYIFLDLGAGVTEESLELLSSANDLFIVTTPEPTALTDAYSLLKQLALLPDLPQIYAIANQTDSSREGELTLSNLSHVTKRFLNIELHKLGMVPHDRTVSKAVKSQVPYTVFQKQAKASVATKQIVDSYLSFKGTRETESESRPFFTRLGKWFNSSKRRNNQLTNKKNR
ncbi:MinD/ParA family protein [Alkalicoccobacillus gibsonii]|uniref:MinD/ParA family protein n=1 Tax=Alkalicoccobacillus gibsonii TaxID=79881 RepID=UPI0019345517|nr:MinD/ParA family protein [Alkalicoccobacillus gibsonii]MBM0065138.1 MinD/ParA family protein [Alkalicoccobacillus gibsonii]